jgi:myo-inositol-1(or 4)-monophosphatase
MSEGELQSRLQVAVEAVQAAAQILTAFRTRIGMRAKSLNDFVTEADERAQQAVAEVVRQAFPGDRFLGEELEAGHTEILSLFGPPTWVVDPLDGTTNYIHRLPVYTVSVAFIVDGEPRVGVILDPERQELFTAVRGSGAFCNGTPIRVSTTHRLADALVATGYPARLADAPDVLHAWQWFSRHSHGVRRTGSTAYNLAHVACGHFDAYYALHIEPWDVAAGLLLVTEAGGKFSSHAGKKYTLGSRELLLVSNDQIHDEFVAASSSLFAARQGSAATLS